MTKETHAKLLRMLFYTGLALLATYLFFRYLFAALLPFLLAFAVASLLRRPTRRISKKLHLPIGIVAALLTVLCVSLILGLLGLLLWQVASEIGGFASEALNSENGFLEECTDFLRRIGDFVARLPFFSGADATLMRERVIETMAEMAKNALMSIASKLPELAGKVASAIPPAFVFFVVTVLSSVYFSVDYERIAAFFRDRMPKNEHQKLLLFFSSAGKTALKFIKSYCLLLVFTFAELFLGFCILGEPYAFLLALVTALVDSLPIFGTGTILIPLALYRLLTGNSGLAIGLLVLYLAVTILRQILEPRILGAGMGVHPLVMLAAMYMGLQLFGVIGMIAAPFFTVMIKNAVQNISTPSDNTSFSIKESS